jgi:phosphate transport system permease protein
VVNFNIFEGMRTLSANIAVELPETAVGSSHFRVLFLAALVLLALTFIVNTLAEIIRQRLRERYSNL